MKIGILIMVLAIIPSLVMAQDWIVDGNRVYVNDSNVFISAEPHTLRVGGEVNFKLISKGYTGNIDVVFGFNETNARPRSASYYNPHNDVVENSYVCNEKFNYTLSPNYAWCYVTENRSTNTTSRYVNVTIFSHSFLRGNISTKTIWWNETTSSDWVDVSDKFQKINYDFGGMTDWYLIRDFSVVAGKEYMLKSDIQVPMKLGSNQGKYWVALKPSAETIQQAIANNHLYYLDPWWNASYIYRQNITNKATGNVTLVVNGTRGWNGKYIYTNCGGDASGTCAIYYNSATDFYVVQNDTVMAPFYTSITDGINSSSDNIINGAYYTMDASGSYKAFGKNHYNLSVQSQVTYVNAFNQSLYGGALNVNGTRDNFNSTESLVAQTTMVMWIKFNTAVTGATTGGAIWSIVADTTQYRTMYFGSVSSDCVGETLLLVTKGSTGEECCITDNIGAGWHSVIYRHNGYAYETWLDGVNRTCSKKAGQPWAKTVLSELRFEFGTRFDNWGNFDGTFDGYTIYQNTITTSEVGEIYRNGLNNGSGSSASGAMSLDVEETSEAGADTCTYSGSGDWSILASDNCVWTTNTNVHGNVLITGSGVLTLKAIFDVDVSKLIMFMNPGITFAINPGGSLS
jgi:hypothetical protein